MKEQKDLFDLFRENEHKLEEQPSRRAWQRLEGRLDAQRRPVGLSVHRQLAMVAAMLVFLLVCFTLLLLPRYESPQLVLNEVDAVPLADLGYKNVDQQANKVMEFTRHLPYRNANPIAEGSPAKKLIPAVFARYQEGNYSGESTVAQPSVFSLFHWLVGDWRAEKNGEISSESWIARDSQSLFGKGFLVKNSDTIFAEQMRIRNVGRKVLFTTSLDLDQNPTHYELVSFSGDRAVFENEKVDFPQQVILKKNSDSAFSTIYQNSKPVNMSKSQMDYMRARNALFNEQAVRRLERVH